MKPMGWLAGMMVAALAACSQGSAPDATVTGYENAQVWTGEGFAPGAIYVQDGVIVEAPEGGAGTVVDLAGAYVIPPLGEAHNHNLDAVAGAKAVSSIYLRQGIFYVKNPNANVSFAGDTREAVSTPDTVDAIFSMGGITAPDGHPVRLYTQILTRYGVYQGMTKEDFVGKAFFEITRPDEIGPVLDTLEAQGADFIKTYLLYSEEYEARKDADVAFGMKGLSPSLYAQVVAAAHERGFSVTTHVETAADFRTAVAAGVDEINHLPGYVWTQGHDADDFRLTPDDVAAAKAAGVVVVTTTGISPQYYSANPEALAAVQGLQAENLRALYEAGVPIAIGSDNYMSTARTEAENLIAMGAFSTPELLGLWIATPKVSIFPERNISCLEPGCEASFIVMPEDPSAGLAALDGITLRIKNGVDLAAQ